MCSIMGVIKRTVPFETLKQHFDATVSRGPDMSRIEEAGEGWICFHRLAIMGLHEEGMQAEGRASGRIQFPERQRLRADPPALREVRDRDVPDAGLGIRADPL